MAQQSMTRKARCGPFGMSLPPRAKAVLLHDDVAKRWCAKNNIATTKAMGEGINSAGAFLVPTELASAIIEQREASGVFRACAQVVPMASDAKEVPTRTSGVTASWTEENIAITGSQPVLSNANLVAAAFVRASSESEEDSAPEFAVGVCPQIIDGTHNASKVAAAAGHDTFAELDA